MMLDVVVKLAFDIEQRDALRGEHEVYHHLWSKGVHRGIATPLMTRKAVLVDFMQVFHSRSCMVVSFLHQDMFRLFQY